MQAEIADIHPGKVRRRLRQQHLPAGARRPPSAPPGVNVRTPRTPRRPGPAPPCAVPFARESGRPRGPVAHRSRPPPHRTHAQRRRGRSRPACQPRRPRRRCQASRNARRCSASTSADPLRNSRSSRVKPSMSGKRERYRPSRELVVHASILSVSACVPPPRTAFAALLSGDIPPCRLSRKARAARRQPRREAALGPQRMEAAGIEPAQGFNRGVKPLARL